MIGRIFSALLGIALASPVLAQGVTLKFRDAERDVQSCFTGSPYPRRDIEVCTFAISDGGQAGVSLATLYERRALAKMRAGELEAALLDYDRAIGLVPESAEAQRGRGEVYRALGRFPEAVGDFDRAIALNPFYAEAPRGRGIARFLAGDIDASEADFVRALEIQDLDPESWMFLGFVRWARGAADADRAFARADALRYAYDYLPLWRFLATARAPARERASEVVRREIAFLAADEWPRDLFRFFLDPSLPDNVVRDAGPHRLTSAFFVGLRLRVTSQPNRADRYLRMVVREGDVTSVERALAKYIVEG
ncbi:MAG: tetratricopeptide repeat protein [Pseudomonadota bacterium]